MEVKIVVTVFVLFDVPAAFTLEVRMKVPPVLRIDLFDFHGHASYNFALNSGSFQK